MFFSAELERESSQLRKQLSDMDSIRLKSAGDVDTERHRREEIEQKLQDAQEQLSVMVLSSIDPTIDQTCLLTFLLCVLETAATGAAGGGSISQDARREGEPTNESARGGVEVLPSGIPEATLFSALVLHKHCALHNLYSYLSLRLSAQILQAESKQRKTLEHLSTQVTQYRKKLADQESQIQILSEKNSDLRVRLDRYARAKKKNGVVISDSGLVGANDADHSGSESTKPSSRAIGLNDESNAKSMDSGRRSSSGKTSGKKPFSPQAKAVESSPAHEAVVIDEESVKEQLKDQLRDLIDLKTCHEELLRLESKGLAISSDDRSDLKNELSKQRSQAEESLRRRIGELDKKVDSLYQCNQKWTNKKQTLSPSSPKSVITSKHPRYLLLLILFRYSITLTI